MTIKIADAPGLTWKLLRTGFEARWRARTDLVEAGFTPKSVRLWRGESPDAVPDAAAVQFLQSYCQRLQAEMLVFGRGNLRKAETEFDGTWGSLIDCYRSNSYSTYQTLRYPSRRNYDNILDRFKTDHGAEVLANANAITFLEWHRTAKGAENKVATAHEMICRVRIILSFGKTLLEDPQCRRLREILSGLRFENSKPREERITHEQASAVIAAAHSMMLHSVAMAQAFAFECTFRQKDVIGEYLPASEPGVYDTADLYGNERWGRGLRWEEIDENLILRHVTSKKQKPIECDLRLAPMVMDELAIAAGLNPANGVMRADLPSTGPVIIYERSGAPYESTQFRQRWRAAARVAGVPDEVFQMDSRAGAISEGLLAGAEIDHVRQSAAHSDIKQTQQYDRAQAEATSKVMTLRVANRNKPGTK